MIGLRVVLDGDWRHDLDELETRLDPEVMGPTVGQMLDEVFSAQVADRFADEGDSSTGAWASLAPSTQRVREWLAGAHGYNIWADTPINVRTGQMKAWATSSGAGAPAAGGWLYLYPGQAPTGPLEKKVNTAQNGTDKPRTPARPILAVTPIEAEMVSHVVAEFLGVD